MSEPDLFEWAHVPVGRSLRDSGFEKVLSNTPEDFSLRLAQAFWYLVDKGEPFTVEDARRLSGDPPAGTHPNAFGALWHGLLSQAGGELEIVDRVLATRASAQARELKVYCARKTAK